jgi:hypothetical protein
MSEGGREAVRDDEVMPAAELHGLVRDLERLLGRKTRRTRSSKRLSTWYDQNSDLAVELCAARRFPMKRVADHPARHIAELLSRSWKPIDPAARPLKPGRPYRKLTIERITGTVQRRSWSRSKTADHPGEL